GHGDYVTFERNMRAEKPVIGWAEFCNTWASNWSYTPTPFKANGYVLGQVARARSLGVNYLLGIGPKADGELSDDAYKNMAALAGWMKNNGVSVHGAGPLRSGETASVTATAKGSTRYLFALPQFRNGGSMEEDIEAAKDETLMHKGVEQKPLSVRLLGDGAKLEFTTGAGEGGAVSVALPAARTEQGALDGADYVLPFQPAVDQHGLVHVPVGFQGPTAVFDLASAARRHHRDAMERIHLARLLVRRPGRLQGLLQQAAMPGS